MCIAIVIEMDGVWYWTMIVKYKYRPVTIKYLFMSKILLHLLIHRTNS